MGFKNKKNRVHPTGNNKKQQRKERKRRRLARLVQRIIPFSCCTGDGVPKNVVCPDTYLKSDKCITNTVITPELTPTSVSPKISPQLKRSASAQSSASKASSRSIKAESPIATTATTATPLVSTESSRSSIVESPPHVTRFCLVPSTGSSSDDDSDGADHVEFNPQPPLKKYPLRQSPQKMASIAGSSKCNEHPNPPKIKQTAAAKSCLSTNYQPAFVDLRDELLFPHATTIPSTRPPTYQRSHYSQLNARAFKSDSEESLTLTEKKSVSSDEFADCFEPQKTVSGIRQQKEEPHEEPSGDDVTAPEKQKTYSREHLDLQNKQVEVSVEQICHREEEEEEEAQVEKTEAQVEAEEEAQVEVEAQDEAEESTIPVNPPNNSEGQSSDSEEELGFFPGEEHIFLPLIKTSVTGLRGWLLTLGIHQHAIQPDPPFSIKEGDKIMSCAINHTLLGISFYVNGFQNGFTFRGESCPYSLDCMFRSAIQNGNTTHLKNFPQDRFLDAIEALKTVKNGTNDAWVLEWDIDSILAPYREMGIELPEQDQPTGLPMEMIRPQTEESSLAYHVTQLDVDACEALLYTFNSYFMVFVPSTDGRVFLLDDHPHKQMEGGAIVLVCPNTTEHVQDMLNRYHFEYFKSPFNLGQGTKFSFRC
ncbi:uncharacterized protein [Apostichopus japonicus]|uniref:uncharacterized protein n=1 Tax=Stichopus japonicus TaxID=307972 RepID=UPI003AB1A805